MAARSRVTTLPSAVKQWLDKSLVDGGFGGYEVLAAELKSRGYDISKSAIHRYGQDFERRLQTLKMATEQARAVVASSPDDEGAMGEALTRLVQEKLFGVLIDLEIDPKSQPNLATVARAVADLSRTSIGQKRWQIEIREQAAKEAKAEAMAAVDSVKKSAGLSEEAVAMIRAQILGVAS